MAGNSSVMASDPPTMEPPPGVTIDLSGSGSQGHWNAVTQATCLSLATIAVILRVFTTLRVIRRWRVDDGRCSPSTVKGASLLTGRSHMLRLVDGTGCLRLSDHGHGDTVWCW